MVTETKPEARPSADGTTKPRIFSGIQPSGIPHIGNYLGAIRHWAIQQHRAQSIHAIVNLHAMTLPYDPADLRERTLELGASLLACGLDPEVAIIFSQSEVPEHTELTWILSTQTMFGELSRMTQFKDRSQGKSDERIGAGLFFYPVLMAADILLYDTDLVPVGEDQRQHVELTRDVAQRFNSTFGETFVIPKVDIKEEGARIMSLDDPTSKMSKSSQRESSLIGLNDDPDTIRRKIRRAVTDSGSEIVARADKPAMSNLLTIYSQVTDAPIAELEAQFQGKGYGEFKDALADAIIEHLTPIRKRIDEYLQDPVELKATLDRGTERAQEYATPKMALVREVTGVSFS